MTPRHAAHHRSFRSTPCRDERIQRRLAMVALLVVTLGPLAYPTTASALAVGPPNDYFANATTIEMYNIPISLTTNVNEATTESFEPLACSYSTQTIWYRLSPTTDTWLSANTSGSSFPYGTNVNVYRDTGSGLFGLSFVGCSYNSPNSNVIFLARGGSTYYLQAEAPCCGSFGNLRVNIATTTPPQPVVNFYYYPSDPSMYDVVQFNDNSSDPAQIGFRSYGWDFGEASVPDTSNDSGYYAYHRFSADGNYTVIHTVTTYDGRTGSASQVVTVKTHDVAISKFQVPQSAASGQTRQISVGIRNTRYPEMVQVSLLKSVPGPFQGFIQIGQLLQYVPVRASNRTTDFIFSYTFTPDDAAIGKVTFQATAYIQSARDALSADNIAVALPTKVGGSISQILGERSGSDEGPSKLALLGTSSNGGNRGLTVSLSLPRSDAASLQVLDVTGRVMVRRDLSSLGAGVHDVDVSWDARPAAGIYWVRLAQGGQFVSSKVAVLP